MVAMSSRSVTSGLRAMTVAAWCRRSCTRMPSSPSSVQTSVHACDRSCRRRGRPLETVPIERLSQPRTDDLLGKRISTYTLAQEQLMRM